MKTKPQPLPVLLKKTQAQFNLYIRLRDKDKPCVSCGSPKIEQASHFYSVGMHSALRFNEDNCHASCLRCNYFLSGNLIPYRAELLRRIGPERLMLLESTATRSRIHKWTAFELEQLLTTFRNKIKELK